MAAAPYDEGLIYVKPNRKPMAKSNNSFIKKQKEATKRKKKEGKEERKLERKQNPGTGKLEDMMAYVDENGNLTTEPPVNKISNTTTTNTKKNENR